jgi:hypothetical protein
MALQSSGAISLSDLATEFPDTTPHSLSEFYRGGGKVPDAAGNSAVPTSGAISLGNFYGAVNRVAINITLSSNQTNYVLNTAKASGYVAGVSDIVLTINSGVYCSSNVVGTPGLDVDTSWASGDTISIVNNGFIVGMGGAGGQGRTSGSWSQATNTCSSSGGSAGSAGGLAFRAQRSVSVNNAGTIAGGGGGGGGGPGVCTSGIFDSESGMYSGGSYTNGGGGGGGRSSSAANSAGGASGGGTLVNAGNQGTVSAAGTGGTSAGLANGGNGGGWGASGSSAGLAGGSGGAAVNGNPNITWVATGTRNGAIA